MMKSANEARERQGVRGPRKRSGRRVLAPVLALFVGLGLAGCDIAAEQTASPGQVTVGEEITFTISGADLDEEQAIRNPTPQGKPPIPEEGEAYSALIGEDTLPEGVAFVSAEPANTADGSFCAGPDANRVVRCFLPFRADSESNKVTITVRATEPGTKTNTAEVFDEYVSFATGVEYPVIERTDPDTGEPVRIRVDPATGMFLDPDLGNPNTNDGDRSNNTATTTTEVLTDTTPPKVVAFSPTGKRVSPKANVTATFSEAMSGASVEAPGTVTLAKKGTARPVAATVVYDAATRKVTLNPARGLSRGAVYRATISTGVEDRSGNVLPAARTWAFGVKP